MKGRTGSIELGKEGDFIAWILPDYIKRLGYPLRAHHPRNYLVVVPPILLMAGLGETNRLLFQMQKMCKRVSEWGYKRWEEGNI